MAFSDPIVAGEDLVRQSIKSPNYQQGLVGWAINKDGTAEFNNLNVIGTATGSSAAYNDIVANDSLIYQGSELSDLLAPFPLGVIASGTFTPPVVSNTTNNTKMGGITWTAQANRAYKIVIYNLGWTQAALGFGGGVVVEVNDENNNGVGRLDVLASSIEHNLGKGYVIPIVNGMSAGPHTFTIYLQPAGSGITTYGDTCVVMIEDIGPVQPNTAFAAAAPAIKTYTLQKNAYHSASYTGSGEASAGSGSSLDSWMYYGQDPGYSPNGNWRSYCWFYGSDLAPMANYASCSQFDVYVYEQWFYNTSGGTLYIGMHTDSSASPPSTEPAGHTYRLVSTTFTGRGQGKWVSLLGNSTIMNAVKNNTFRGIVLGPGPSTSYSYYGYANGAYNGQPTIRATYTK